MRKLEVDLSTFQESDEIKWIIVVPVKDLSALRCQYTCQYLLAVKVFGSRPVFSISESLHTGRCTVVRANCTHRVLYYQTIQSLRPCPARLNGVSKCFRFQRHHHGEKALFSLVSLLKKPCCPVERLAKSIFSLSR